MGVMHPDAMSALGARLVRLLERSFLMFRLRFDGTSIRARQRPGSRTLERGWDALLAAAALPARQAMAATPSIRPSRRRWPALMRPKLMFIYPPLIARLVKDSASDIGLE